MRILAVIIILNFFNLSIAQDDIVKTDSLLLWQSERKLAWNDFKGKPKENPINEVAIINVKIEVSLEYWDKDIPIFQVKTYMKKFSSWNIVTDSLSLIHEQGHFDIYELFSRKIRHAYDSLNRNKVVDVKVYKKTYKNFFDKCRKMNSLYEYSNFDKGKQREWTIRINDELEELKEYEYIPIKI